MDRRSFIKQSINGFIALSAATAIVKAASKLLESDRLAPSQGNMSEKVKKIAEYVKNKKMFPGMQIKYWPDYRTKKIDYVNGDYDIIFVTNGKRYDLTYRKYENEEFLWIDIRDPNLPKHDHLNYIPGMIRFQDLGLTGEIHEGIKQNYENIKYIAYSKAKSTQYISHDKYRPYLQTLYEYHINILSDFYAKGAGNQ